MDQKIIGERIRKKRIELDLSQKDLAGKIEVSPPAINRFEKGLKTPSTESIVKLAKVLGVSTDYLLGASEEEDMFIDEETIEVFKGFKDLTPVNRNQISANIRFLKSDK